MNLPTTYSDQESCLEAIGQILAGSAPEPWIWIRATAELEGTATTTELSYQLIDRGREPEPFFIKDGATDWEHVDCSRQLAKLLTTEKVGPFRKCQYLLQNDGKYRADYEY